VFTISTSTSGGVKATLLFVLVMMKSELVALKTGLCAKLERDFQAAQRGQMTNLTQLVIGILISGLVIMEVFIPVISDAAANLSGTEGTIANLLPLFAVLLLLIALAAPLMSRTR